MIPCTTMQRALALRATLASLDPRPVVPGQCAAGFALFLVTPGTVAGPKFVLGGAGNDWAMRWLRACQWWEAQDVSTQLLVCGRHIQHTEQLLFGPLWSCFQCNTAAQTGTENGGVAYGR